VIVVADDVGGDAGNGKQIEPIGGESHRAGGRYACHRNAIMAESHPHGADDDCIFGVYRVAIAIADDVF